MIALTYQIRLVEPALLTAQEGEPNSAISYDFLPGSALRGAIIAALLQKDPAADPLPLLSENLCFLNGYPSDGEMRALPLPLSLRRDKQNDSNDPTVHDQAYGALEDRIEWKPAGGSFAFVETQGRGRKIAVRRQIAIHSTRNRRAGRARTDDGAVFRYDALAAGQTFQAVILCREKTLADQIETLILDIARLGGSARGGYGKVEANHVQRLTLRENNQEEGVWAEHPFLAPEALHKQMVIFLSDAIIRDANGQHTVSPSDLAAAVGTAVDADQVNAFLETTIVGGFNREWGLPLPQTLAVRRGSVLMLPAQTLSDEEIARLEREGIGERRAEGFGRLAVTSSCPVWSLSDAQRPEVPWIVLKASSSLAIAAHLSRRIQVQRIADKVRQRVAETHFSRSDLRSSQIARLREVIRLELQKRPGIGKASDNTVRPGADAALLLPDPGCIVHFLERLRKTARQQFEKARVGSVPLDEWLRKQAQEGIFVGDAPRIGGILPTTEEELRNRACLEYVDAVLARMAKQEEVIEQETQESLR